MDSTTSRYQESKDTQSNTKDGQLTRTKSMDKIKEIIELANEGIATAEKKSDILRLELILIKAQIVETRIEQALKSLK